MLTATGIWCAPALPWRRTPSPKWGLLLEPRGKSGAENMAIDLALLAEASRSGRAVLRLYRWDPPCLSLGRNEAALAQYDRAAIAQLRLAVVRRPTGGRAVWHEHEVTYAVAAPIAAFGSPRRGYRWIHERLAAALRSLGVEAALAPRPARPVAPDLPGSCFSAPAGGEVLASGRKVIGSAQVRAGTAFLQHGSILLDGTQAVIAAVRRGPTQGEREGRGEAGKETTLSAVLGRPVGFGEVAAAIVATWDGPLVPAAPPAGAAPYDEGWTWRR